MKTLSFIINLFIATNSFSQLPVWIQVTGKPETKLILQQAYTKDEIIEKYGEPKEFETHDDEAFDGIVSSYTYDELYIHLLENKLNQFSFNDNRLELKMECWNMTIKPGDDINRYRNLSEDKAYHIENFGSHLTLMVTINGNQADIHLRLYYDKDQKIRTIEWFVPV